MEKMDTTNHYQEEILRYHCLSMSSSSQKENKVTSSKSISFTRMMKWLAHKRKHLSYVHHDKSVLGYFHRDYVFHWDFVKYMSAVQNNFVSVFCESKLRLEQRSHHFEKTFVSPTVNIFVERSYSLKMERD